MKPSRAKQSSLALIVLLITSLSCSQLQTPATAEVPVVETAKPEPTATETTAPTPTQVAEQNKLGEVVFQDDFADNSNNWYVGVDSETDSVVEDGQFKVKVLEQDTSFSFDPPVEVADVDITVDTEFLEGAPENAGYGLLCHAIDADNRYRVRIAPDGYYAINKTVGGKTTDLVNWTSAGAINQGIGVVNRIRVICSENHITLYVNDILLSDVMDSELSGGSFALLTASYKNNENDTNPVKVGFSNLTVRKPLAWERPDEALLFDWFDNNNNSWAVFEENGNSAQIESGQMIIKVATDDSLFRTWPQLTLSNVDISFDATIQEGTQSNVSYGTACHFANMDNLYSFRIDGDGYYALEKKVEGKWEALVDWTASSAVKAGAGQTNHIRVVCTNSTLELYANEQQLISIQDTALTGSGFALEVSRGTADKNPVSVSFDNVEVKYP